MGEMDKSQRKDGEVSLRSESMRENLPYPLVHYPNHYGTFIAFSRSQDEPPVLCACAEASVRNYIQLRSSDPNPSVNSNKLRMAPLDSFNFPNALAALSLTEKADPIRVLNFESKLCHRCNITPPRLRYCHPMYGGEFKLTFGWYINQALFRSGIDRDLERYLSHICPTEVQLLIAQFQDSIARSNDMSRRFEKKANDTNRVSLHEAQSQVQSLKRKIWNVFENETRREFGIRDIGDGWVSEGILFQIVSNIFKGQECIRHLRPSWLEGLELDIFIPARNIAFEYQGQQHSEPIEHWGGQAALEDLIQRDDRKAELCLARGVSLIAIDYTEPLTENHIVDRLGKLIRSNKKRAT